MKGDKQKWIRAVTDAAAAGKLGSGLFYTKGDVRLTCDNAICPVAHFAVQEGLVDKFNDGYANEGRLGAFPWSSYDSLTRHGADSEGCLKAALHVIEESELE